MQHFEIKEIKKIFDYGCSNPPWHSGKDHSAYLKHISRWRPCVKDFICVNPATFLKNKNSKFREWILYFKNIILDDEIDVAFRDQGIGTTSASIIRLTHDKNDVCVVQKNGKIYKIDLLKNKDDIVSTMFMNEDIKNKYNEIFSVGYLDIKSGKGSVKDKEGDDNKEFRYNSDDVYIFPAYLSSHPERRCVYAKKPAVGQNILKLIIAGILEPKHVEYYTEISYEKGVGRYAYYVEILNEEEGKNIQKWFKSDTYKWIDKHFRNGRYAHIRIPKNYIKFI